MQVVPRPHGYTWDIILQEGGRGEGVALCVGGEGQKLEGNPAIVVRRREGGGEGVRMGGKRGRE